MPTISLLLTPADVAMFRESRPFGPGVTGVRSQFPTPQAAAGAVRTWLLRGLGADLTELRRLSEKEKLPLLEALETICPAEHRWVLRAKLAGPLVCKDTTCYFAAPRLLARLEGTDGNSGGGMLLKASPLKDPPPGWQVPKDAPEKHRFRPVWVRTKSPWKSVETGYLTGPLMEIQVLWRPGAISEARLTGEDELFGWEPRLGIGIDPARLTAEEGRLYTASFLRLQAGIRFRVDLTADLVDLQERVQALCDREPWLRLGGESKPAHVEVQSLMEMPGRLDWPPTNGRFYTCLVTPGLFRGGGWVPWKLAEKYHLIAAITGPPLAFSRWDGPANRPCSTRYAVRAGAVYFWQIREGQTVGEKDDPHGKRISDSCEDRQTGWGLCLRGEWDDA